MSSPPDESVREDAPGLSRRRLLSGLGATAAVTVAAGAAARSRSEVGSWDMRTDVLVVGSGAAGIAAALEARRAGARVLVVEALTQFGGASAMSAKTTSGRTQRCRAISPPSTTTSWPSSSMVRKNHVANRFFAPSGVVQWDR